MEYLITHKPTFLRNFNDLSKDLRNRTTKAIDQFLRVDPVNFDSKNLEKLKYCHPYCSCRVSDSHRILYTVHNQIVMLQDVGDHDYIYRQAKRAEPDIAVVGSETIADILDPASSVTPAEIPNWPARQIAPRSGHRPTGVPLPMEIRPDNLEELRIPPVYHQGLLACMTDDDLDALDLPEDIYEKVFNWLYEQPSLLDIAQEPTYVLHDTEDLNRYAEGDLLGFLLWLDEEQRRLVDFGLRGPTLVKGGPGSGKSTVALYRVKTVLDRDISASRVLFTTYTNALVNASEQLLRQLEVDLSRVEISTIDKMARRIVDETARQPLRMADRQDWEAALSAARVHFEPGSLTGRLLHRDYRFPDSYLIDELHDVIEGQVVTSLDEYLVVQRYGRSFPLNPDMRQAIWDLYQYVTLYFERNELITWNRLRRRALDYVQSRQWASRFDYVIVDEAQDLSPVALALCVALCRSPQGVFLTADASQSIYNKGFAWSKVHEDLRVTGHTRLLKRNYRTTRQIAEAAHNFLRSVGAGDGDTLAQGYVHSGPRPELFAAHDSERQFDWLYDRIHQAMQEIRQKWEAVAVLVRSNDLGEQIAARLDAQGMPAMFVSGGRHLDLSAPCVKVITMHSAKGLEFPVVFVPCLNQDVLPRNLDETAEDYREKLAEEQRLFYVAMTRAMRRLYVSFESTAPSEFVGALASDFWIMVNDS